MHVDSLQPWEGSRFASSVFYRPILFSDGGIPVRSHATKPLQLLLLWDRARHTASTVRQHVAALQSYSVHQVHPIAVFGELPPRLQLERFDGLVIHYSLVACHDGYVSQTMRQAIARFNGVKAIFIQDEYRHVDRTVAAVRAMGIQVLFTCVPTVEVERVYPADKLPGVIRHSVLTGYVDESLIGLQVPDPAHRPIDIGYRARKLPAWLGELGQEKWNIGHRVAEDAPRFGLKVDLAHREEERLYGEDWIDFMTRCKSTLGVESGASVFDFTGELQKAVESDAAQHPHFSFEQLKSRHFADVEGKIRLNQISPRCFEAAALRTLMVLYEGNYSGRLQPWRHYVPLKKDHSNFGEVVSVLRSPERIREITARAYEEVARAEGNSFRTMVREFDEVISAGSVHCNRARLPPYTDRQIEDLESRRSLKGEWLRFRRQLFTDVYFLFFRGLAHALSEQRRDGIQQWLRARLRAIKTFIASSEMRRKQP